jgi:pimeloyl-ACP methyl ester carboxylesterase
MATYVLAHGAWHTGELMEATAAPIREAGHRVFLPTLAGNRPGDLKSVGLEEAIQSLVDFFASNEIQDAVLVGHSYGGMAITGLADRLPQRIHRLVYWNAFIPYSGECLNDLVPQFYIDLFDAIQQPDGSVMLPFPIWREAFINDASLELAQSAYGQLNPHPYQTFKDGIKLSTNPAGMNIPKSFINCTEDTAMPHSLPWHPRLSEKLGLYRLVQAPGSHELCFSNPALLAEKIMQAGRD